LHFFRFWCIIFLHVNHRRFRCRFRIYSRRFFLNRRWFLYFSRRLRFNSRRLWLWLWHRFWFWGRGRRLFDRFRRLRSGFRGWLWSWSWLGLNWRLWLRSWIWLYNRRNLWNNRNWLR
jgi:hypothetical protein